MTIPTDSRVDGLVPLIAVGASAGGLEAFRLLVEGLSQDQRFAVVLVQHLDPDHDSLMPELIAAKTKATVHSISDGMAVTAGEIYLCPPGFELVIADGKLQLEKFSTPRGLRRPIDRFFRSVASEYRYRGVAVVLSGTGSDGAEGAREVKAQDGLVFVQDPKEAKYDGMPRSAIDNGTADAVLRATEIVDVASEYRSARDGIEPVLANDTEFLDRILRQVRFRTGHDFSNYKTATMLRRIAVRMSVLGLKTPASYLQHMVEHRDEADLLFRDLLINVTSFFRDADNFDVLAKGAIADIVARTEEHGEIRVWSVGCSTGEEAYTLGILFLEELTRTDRRCSISIFGTDIDEQALATARRGTYSNAIADVIPAAMLDRYFLPTSNGYEVAPPLREMVRFSRHSFIKDPPFSKIDLVTCRNVLIYLNDTLQELAMRVFHYGLDEGGFLFLGSSENPRTIDASFTDVDTRARIFRRRPGLARPLHLDGLSSAVPKVSQGPMPPVAKPLSNVSQALLDRHVPPYLHIDREGQVIAVSDSAARYLSIRGGAMTTEVMELIVPELESTLRRIVNLAPQTGDVLEREFQGHLNGQDARVVVSGQRLEDGSLLIVLQDRLDLRADRPGAGDPATNDYIVKLEHDLDEARQNQRSTVEELETSNEELKSSNEEMMSMNEELQSANEELTTINDELQDKLGQLNQSNHDLQNFISSARVPTVFLDDALRLRRFTPEARDYFSFAPNDEGRPVEELSSAIDSERLLEMCRACLSSGDEAEEQFETREGEVVLVRVMPNLASPTAVQGCVITLTDVTELMRALDDARAAREEAELRLEEVDQVYRNSPMGMGLIDRDMRYVRVNQKLAEINGRAPEEHAGARVQDVVPDVADETIRLVQQVFDTGQAVRDVEIVGTTPADEETNRIWESDWIPFYSGTALTAVSVTVRDVTEARETATSLRRIMQELEHRVKNMLANVVSLMNRARRESISDTEVYTKLTRRVESLSKTHALLTAEDWSSAPLRQIIEAETVEIYDAERVTLSGPPVRLNSRATLAIGMTIHEMATNAAKYGAFSTPDGHISITWTRIVDDDGDRVELIWHETGGPQVIAPDRKGFGSQLVTASIVGNLDGEIDFAWEPNGLRCVMKLDHDVICGQGPTPNA